MKELEKFANEMILKYPEHLLDIQELFQLCKDEIEAGESQQNEIDLCYSSIEDLIK